MKHNCISMPISHDLETSHFDTPAHPHAGRVSDGDGGTHHHTPPTLMLRIVAGASKRTRAMLCGDYQAVEQWYLLSGAGLAQAPMVRSSCGEDGRREGSRMYQESAG